MRALWPRCVVVWRARAPRAGARGWCSHRHHHPPTPHHTNYTPHPQKKQKNRLLKLEIIITVATFSLALYNLAAGVLGENLVLPGAWTADVQGFVAINGTMLTLCVAAFFGIVHFMRKRKLI